jgi:ABC-type branched-subunit amino acid transport system ATPase component
MEALRQEGGSSYLLEINTLRGYIPASLVRKGRKHVDEGVTEMFDSLAVPEALQIAVKEDNYNIIWNAAFKYVLTSYNFQPLSNLSAQGCKELWQRTHDVIRRVSHEHLGSASLTVKTNNCVALLQDGCSEALKQVAVEKNIPTVLYDPNKYETDKRQNQYMFSLFCQLLRKAGLSYQQTSMHDDEYKEWLKNASIIPAKLDNGVVTEYERQPY